MLAILNVSIALEDPFDNYGLDGIFLDEQLYEVEQAIAMTSGSSYNSAGVASGMAQQVGGASVDQLPVPRTNTSGDAANGVLPTAFAVPSPQRNVRIETDAV